MCVCVCGGGGGLFVLLFTLVQVVIYSCYMYVLKFLTYSNNNSDYNNYIASGERWDRTEN